MFELIHFLHVAIALIWAGSAVTTTLIWGPALVVLEPDALGKYRQAVGMRAGRIMKWAAILTILTGIARAIVGGRIQSPGDLLTPYGLFVIASLAIFIGMRVYGTYAGRPVVAAMQSGDDPRPAMQRSFVRDAVVYIGGVLVLVAMMVWMGLGRV